MSVSLSETDRRSCPACGVEVVSEIWLIVHRRERPKLWSRAPELFMLTCNNGHRGRINSPLLLFDPKCPFVIFSPPNGASPSDARTMANYFLGLLGDSLPEDEKIPGRAVEIVSSEMLPIVLNSAIVNLGDMAPGAAATDEALRICADVRAGRVSPDRLRALANDARLPKELQAGLRFELATYLSNKSIADAHTAEEAISEWRRVLQAYPRTASPGRWAIACLELAQCYSHRDEGSRAANMREALRLLDSALEVLTVERYPEDFALAQSRRANLLLDMGSDAVSIDNSLAAFEQAQRVYTRESYPDDCALTLSNMATAYLTRGGYAGLDDLRHAIKIMEEVLTIRTRDTHPYEWALTQMNMGLALSRLPVSDRSEPHRRAVEALRESYNVLSELGDNTGRLSAAYNLGITLTRQRNPEHAEEAVTRLEESIPWLLATGQTEQAADGLASLADSYVAWLDHEAVTERADAICRRMLDSFKDHTESKAAIKAHHEVGLWMLKHAESNSHRFDLARVAFERILTATRSPEYAELRAGTLANMATVLLLQQSGSGDLNRVRARNCMDEALKILRTLPLTPERETAIGLIVSNKIRSGLDETLGKD